MIISLFRYNLDGESVKMFFLKIGFLFLCAFHVESALSAGWSFADGNKGKGYTVCEMVKKRLNQIKYPKQFSICTPHVIATMPGFISPPWQDLDPVKHKALLYKLFLYRQSGAADYFSGNPPKNVVNPEDEAKNALSAFFDRGGRLQIWRTHFPLNHMPYIVGDITLIQLSERNLNAGKILGECNSTKPKDWTGYIYGVTDDLAGPDPRIGESAKEIFASSDVFLYFGSPILCFVSIFSRNLY